MLVRIIDRVAPKNIGEIAEEVGAEVGRELAAEIGSPEDSGYEAAIRAVVRAMTGIGFGVSSDVAGQRLLMSHCPFGETAAAHPEVVCSLDRAWSRRSWARSPTRVSPCCTRLRTPKRVA